MGVYKLKIIAFTFNRFFIALLLANISKSKFHCCQDVDKCWNISSSGACESFTGNTIWDSTPDSICLDSVKMGSTDCVPLDDVEVTLNTTIKQLRAVTPVSSIRENLLSSQIIGFLLQKNTKDCIDEDSNEILIKWKDRLVKAKRIGEAKAKEEKDNPKSLNRILGGVN